MRRYREETDLSRKMPKELKRDVKKNGTSSDEGFKRRKSKFENEDRDVKEMPED